jgi:hypothetical protein
MLPPQADRGSLLWHKDCCFLGQVLTDPEAIYAAAGGQC